MKNFQAEQKTAWKNSKVVNFAFGENALPKKVTPKWLKEVHVCPTCNQVITDPEEVQFMMFEGECAGCEHIRGSLAKEDLYEISK